MGFTHPDQGMNDGFLIRLGMTMGVLSSILQMFDDSSCDFSGVNCFEDFSVGWAKKNTMK